MELKINLFFKDFPILAPHTNWGSKPVNFALRLNMKNVKNFKFFLSVVVIWSKLDARVDVSRRFCDRSVFQDALVHTERTSPSTFILLGGGGHYWAKKLKSPGKHQKSRECTGNHGKHVKIPENSGTFF